jgi:hypothetical protein
VVRATTDGRVVTTHFLNVDLGIKSRADLAPLLAKLDPKVVVLHQRRDRGFHHASMELYEFSRYLDPERCIEGFARLIEKLPPATRRVWDRAAHRRFNIGIEAETGAPYLALLEAKTIRRVAAVNGELVITVYCPRPERASRRRGL